MGLSLIVLAAVAAYAPDDKTGDAIYRRLCAECHGPRGEGSKENPEPLTGDKSIEKLASFIEKKMPKGGIGKCVGEDAKKVSEYIFGAFYSPTAQVRVRPARVELSRLTVLQYRNAIADLLAGFGEAGKWDAQRGLKGEYYNAKRAQNDKRVVDQVVPQINLTSPPSDKLNGEEQFFRWTGGLLAPDTGEYEFNLESENGARLWVNDPDHTLVDAWVRSGNDKRHPGTITLLGGRVYLLKAEVFKAKNEKTVSAVLKWKRPHRAEEVVPERVLSPGRFFELAVVKTPFPPDDRSLGYERGASISKAWDEAETDAALEVADYVVARLERLAGRKPNAPDAKDRLREFGRKFCERAFRRPLTPDLQKFFVDRHFEADGDLELAIKKVILLALKSPRFLYLEGGSETRDGFDAAGSLSFGLWDSLPDSELFEAARAGKLSTPEAVAKQAARMVGDLRARAKLRTFFFQWLQLDRLRELTKDAKRFPDFNEEIVSDLRTSLDLFLEEVAWNEASDFRQLLLADFLPLNGRLAKLYGADLPPDAPFQKISLGAEKSAGILTHPLLMAGFAYDSTSSPIHRGVFVARSLLGRRMRPPPDAVTPLDPELHPDMTTRERITLQTRSNACLSCHATINPLGFALEHFDAVGRYRDEERGKPIDASGRYDAPGGEVVPFNGARQLGVILAKSEETQMAFVEHLFHHLLRQPVLAYGPDRLASLRASFAQHDFSIRALMVDMMSVTALADHRPSKGKKP
jgi:hypothetical protein